MDLDVLVVGDANPDLVLRGDVRPRWGQAEQLLDGADLVLGGSAAITAAGCAKLGLRTALLAAVGADHLGEFTRQRLAELGVHTGLLRTDETTPTGVSVILSAPDDRAILTLPGTIPTLRPRDLTDAVLASARHVHIASVFLQPTLAAGLAGAIRRARDLGATVTVDTNWDPTGTWTTAAQAIRAADALLPNRAELLALTGRAGPGVGAGTSGPDGAGAAAAAVEAAIEAAAIEAAAAELVRAGVVVVLKDGANGARAWWPGGSGAAPGLAVEVADTTGAGDTFNAGFIAARLDGRTVAEAARWAAVAGSLSTRAAGGTAAQPDRAELRTALLSPSSR